MARFDNVIEFTGRVAQLEKLHQQLIDRGLRLQDLSDNIREDIQRKLKELTEDEARELGARCRAQMAKVVR
jgi:hypothetical protein